MSEKYQLFNGLKFTKDEKTGYYLNSTIKERIHRYVWKHFNGDIPKGFAIHHVDHDKSNNDISNLLLVGRSKHATIHGNDRAENHYDEMVKNLSENARPKASEWHGSTEGLEWHKEHYNNFKETLHAEKEFMCKQCGDKFLSIRSGFCSNSCKSKWRRESGVDDESRVCRQCNNEFKINKYSKTTVCSRSCSNRLQPRLPQLRKNKGD